MSHFLRLTFETHTTCSVEFIYLMKAGARSKEERDGVKEGLGENRKA